VGEALFNSPPGLLSMIQFDGHATPRWYVACTLPRHEKMAAEQLATKQLEIYLPLYTSVRNWKGRRAHVRLPLFPGYVFIHIPLNERRRVLEHSSILRFVTFRGKPASVPDEEIDCLRNALNRCAAEPYPFLAIGKNVRIRSGPLAGLEGKVVRRKGKMRLIVSIDSIQRSVLFEVDGSDLEVTSGRAGVAN
jgi:transcription antitermination factor NusG